MFKIHLTRKSLIIYQETREPILYLSDPLKKDGKSFLKAFVY